jgi:hypothetical protein
MTPRLEPATPALIPRFDFMSDTQHFAVARGCVKSCMIAASR